MSIRRRKNNGNDKPVSDIGLDKTEHLLGGLGNLDEDAVVNLEETEELEDFAGLGGDLIDTGRTQTNKKHE